MMSPPIYNRFHISFDILSMVITQWCFSAVVLAHCSHETRPCKQGRQGDTPPFVLSGSESRSLAILRGKRRRKNRGRPAFRTTNPNPSRAFSQDRQQGALSDRERRVCLQVACAKLDGRPGHLVDVEEKTSTTLQWVLLLLRVGEAGARGDS